MKDAGVQTASLWGQTPAERQALQCPVRHGLFSQLCRRGGPPQGVAPDMPKVPQLGLGPRGQNRSALPLLGRGASDICAHVTLVLAELLGPEAGRGNDLG